MREEGEHKLLPWQTLRVSERGIPRSCCNVHMTFTRARKPRQVLEIWILLMQCPHSLPLHRQPPINAAAGEGVARRGGEVEVAWQPPPSSCARLMREREGERERGALNANDFGMRRN